MPASAKIPVSAGLDDVVFRRGQAEPDVVMLRRWTPPGGWQDVTAAQFCAEVAALSKGIIGAGIEPGDRVGLMSRTRYEWTLIDYAIWAAGAVTVPVYETSSAGQIEWILSDSAVRAVFAETGTHEQLISGDRGSLPGLEHLWMIDALDTLAPRDGLRLPFQLNGEESKYALARWLSWASRCRIPEFTQLAETIRSHPPSIHATPGHLLSNGLIDGEHQDKSHHPDGPSGSATQRLSSAWPCSPPAASDPASPEDDQQTAHATGEATFIVDVHGIAQLSTFITTVR